MLAAAEQLGPMAPRPFRVAAVRPEIPEVVTLELEPVEGTAPGFVPGQFMMLYAFGVGEVPISVCGSANGSLLHTIRAVGAVTRALCAVRPGDILGSRGPFGTGWDLASAEGTDVVVVGGGLGVAPLLPAIQHLAANRERFGRVSVLAGARSPDLLLFPGELEALAETGVHVSTIVDHAAPGWTGPVGVVPDLIPGAPFDPSTAVALVCGPEVMMRFAAEALINSGVQPDRVRVSMERNMKCAIGHCGHCQLGPEFICKDGPVFTYPRISRWLGIREM